MLYFLRFCLSSLAAISGECLQHIFFRFPVMWSSGDVSGCDGFGPELLGKVRDCWDAAQELFLLKAEMHPSAP